MGKFQTTEEENAQKLCEDKFRKAKTSQDIDEAYEEYLDVIGWSWPDLMLSTWQLAHGSRIFEMGKNAN